MCDKDKIKQIKNLIEEYKINTSCIGMSDYEEGCYDKLKDVVEELEDIIYPVIKFEVDKTYRGTFITDSDLTLDIYVVRRTEQTIWFKCLKNNTKFEELEVVRRKKEIFEKNEIIYPLGKYSMALIISAKDKIIEKENKKNEQVRKIH